MTRPTDCCSTDLPDATPTDRAGSASSEQNRTSSGTVARPLSCAQCGNDPDAIVRAFRAGMQAAAWDSYKPNLEATAAREAWAAANPGADWRANVHRFGDTPPKPTPAEQAAYRDHIARMGLKR